MRSPCSVDDCDRPHYGRGYCRMHWKRWRRWGNPLGARPARGTCSIDGCERPHFGRGYCAMHHERWRRTGDPGPAQPTWQTGRTCQLPDCDEPHEGHGFCRTHYLHWKKHGDPYFVEFVVRADGKVGNSMAHRRVAQRRGPASNHACQHCGGLAAEWAYDHEDPDERYDEIRGPYSLQVERYMPLCRRCHRRFDLAHAKGA